MKTSRGIIYILILFLIILSFLYDSAIAKHATIIFLFYTIILLFFKKTEGLEHLLGILSSSCLVLLTFSIIPTKFYIIAFMLAFADAAWHGA